MGKGGRKQTIFFPSLIPSKLEPSSNTLPTTLYIHNIRSLTYLNPIISKAHFEKDEGWKFNVIYRVPLTLENGIDNHGTT